MKLVVIGDIHGRSCWKDIINKEEYDKVIFLGDYVSTHEKMTEEDQINNLEEILHFKETNPDKVVLLRGNHDTQHLGYDWAGCSGLFRNVQQYMSEQRKRFLEDTQWIYVQDGIVFSHAGISDEWMTNSGFMNLNEVLNALPDERFGFIPDSMWDNYGDSVTQSCVWIRPQSLCKCNLEHYDQVVGHTPVLRITDIYKSAKKKRHIWLCDALPYEYLVIEDGEFRVRRLDDKKIRLINREADLWLEQCDDGSWEFKSTESYITESMTIGIDGDNEDTIISIDPSGGPYITTGFKIGDYTVSKIRNDLHLILTLNE